MKVTIKTLDSQDHDFEFDDNLTIREFKEYVQSTVDVPPDQQRLIFCGKILQDDKKMIDFDCHEKVLHLVKRPPLTPPSEQMAGQPTSDPNQEQVTNSDPIRDTLTSVISIYNDTQMSDPQQQALRNRMDQAVRLISSTLLRALIDDNRPTNAISTAISLTITPQFVATTPNPNSSPNPNPDSTATGDSREPSLD